MSATMVQTGMVQESLGAAAKPGNVQLDVLRVSPADSAEFRSALNRHANGNANGVAGVAGPQNGNGNSLGDRIMTRATDLASEVKRDHAYVSKTLEQASRSADSMQLMKAMLALNDYQMRVQFISKVASKATSSIDQLTKLQ